MKVITLKGVASVPDGLGYPGVSYGGGIDLEKIPCTIGGLLDPGCVTVKTGPKNEPMLNFAPEGNHSAFDLTSDICVKVSVSTDPTKKTPGLAVCGVVASGVIWGYCGLATGVGVMSISNFGPPPFDKSPATISTEIKFTEVAGIWYVTGGDWETWITGALETHPVPSRPDDPNCFTKSANSFSFEGRLYYKDLTIEGSR